MSSLPVARHHAATSLMDPTSVASSSTTAPEGSGLTAWAVFTIGIGHDSPRASIVWVISTSGMGVLLWGLRRSDEDDLTLAGVEVEGGHALHAVHERVEIGRFEVEQ